MNSQDEQHVYMQCCICLHTLAMETIKLLRKAYIGLSVWLNRRYISGIPYSQQTWIKHHYVRKKVAHHECGSQKQPFIPFEQ